MSLFIKEFHELTQYEATQLYLYLAIYGQDAHEQVKGGERMRELLFTVENRFKNIVEDSRALPIRKAMSSMEHSFRSKWELYVFSGENADLIRLTPLFFDVLAAHEHLVVTKDEGDQSD